VTCLTGLTSTLPYSSVVYLTLSAITAGSSAIRTMGAIVTTIIRVVRDSLGIALRAHFAAVAATPNAAVFTGAPSGSSPTRLLFPRRGLDADPVVHRRRNPLGATEVALYDQDQDVAKKKTGYQPPGSIRNLVSLSAA